MSISITFLGEEEPGDVRVLTVGEKLLGQIVVEASEEVEFREISLGFPWEVTGRGNAVRGREGDVVVAREGGWPAGSTSPR